MADSEGIERFIGIGSGKGGVGKSTITVNFGIAYARRGLRTAIVDMDPLSNLATVLDIPARILDALPEDLGSRNLKNYIAPIAPNLDLLFPRPKLKDGTVRQLRDLVFEFFYPQLVANYDLVLLDLPAGIQQDENLFILPRINHLLVVLNPEPTSHVSAGGYIRAALDVQPRLRIFTLNNRYRQDLSDPAFNHKDLVGNYNRFVPEELQIRPEEAEAILDIGRVTMDPALNLLWSEPDYESFLLYRIEETSQLLRELWTPEPREEDIAGLPGIFRRLVRYGLLYQKGDASLNELLAYVRAISGSSSVWEDPRILSGLERYRKRVSKDPRRRGLDKVGHIFDRLRDAPAGMRGRLRAALIRSSYDLLSLISGQLDSPMEQKAAGLLLYYLVVLGLLRTPEIHQLLGRLVPKRRVGTSRQRDRSRQIQHLIREDPKIREAFSLFIRNIHPIFIKKLAETSRVQNFREFLFREPHEGRSIQQTAYVKLSSRLIHDFMFAGLGVAVGLQDSRAGEEIRSAAESLLEHGLGVRAPGKVEAERG